MNNSVNDVMVVEGCVCVCIHTHIYSEYVCVHVFICMCVHMCIHTHMYSRI